MKEKSRYHKLPLQTISRRVWSSFIDGLLLLILGVVLTLTLGFTILKNNEFFVQNNNQCFDSIREMYRIQDETRLQKLKEDDDTKVIATADYFDEYIIKQIRLSYFTFENEFKKENITLEIKDNNYSTLQNDELAYYFVYYKQDNNINITDYNNEIPLSYFKKIFFENINKDYYLDREDDLPVIKSEYAIRLYKHYIEESYDNDLYYEFSDAVLAIRKLGLDDLSSFNEFDNYYQLYNRAYSVMAKYENVVLLTMMLIAHFILIGGPNIFSKNGISVGKLLTRTRIIKNNDYDISKWFLLLISGLSFISYLIVILFISLFTFGFSNLTISLFMIGGLEITFLQILLLGFAFMLVNFFMMCLTSDKRALIDIISNTKQVDVTTYIEEKNIQN